MKKKIDKVISVTPSANGTVKQHTGKPNGGVDKLRVVIINQFLRQGVHPTGEQLLELAADNDMNLPVAESIYKAVFKDMSDEFGFAAFHIFKKAKFILTKKWEIRKNIVSEQLEMREHGAAEFEQVNINTLYCYLNEKKSVKIKMQDLKAILESNYIRQYDPIFSYFESLNFDSSEDFIDKLSAHVVCTDQQFWQSQFKKSLVRMVACGLGKYVNRVIMVLQGQKQQTGKTTFIRELSPKQLKQYYTESPISGNAKDVSIRLSENFIYNMEELEGMQKKEVSAVKAMLSTQTTKERRAYGVYETTRKRRVNFWASTNPKDMLQDTENTRWLIFEVLSVSWQYSHSIDINKVWAQAYHLYNSGFDYQLTKEESLIQAAANEAYRIVKPEEELIALYFELPSDGCKGQFLTATQIVHELNRVYEKTRLSPMYVGRAVKKVLGIESINNGKGIRGYMLVNNVPATE